MARIARRLAREASEVSPRISSCWRREGECELRECREAASGRDGESALAGDADLVREAADFGFGGFDFGQRDGLDVPDEQDWRGGYLCRIAPRILAERQCGAGARDRAACGDHGQWSEEGRITGGVGCD